MHVSRMTVVEMNQVDAQIASGRPIIVTAVQVATTSGNIKKVTLLDNDSNVLFNLRSSNDRGTFLYKLNAMFSDGVRVTTEANVVATVFHTSGGA